MCQLKTQFREEQEECAVRVAEVERRMVEARMALEEAVGERDQLREELDR